MSQSVSQRKTKHMVINQHQQQEQRHHQLEQSNVNDPLLDRKMGDVTSGLVPHFSNILRKVLLYIPAESQNTILEQMSEFNRFKEPSKLFLRFAEWYLSSGKADSEHYHTISSKNCLLRVPGSYNSKNMSQVRIVQKWNGTSKMLLQLLYDKFLAYLIGQGSKVVKHANDKTTLLYHRIPTLHM